MIKYVIIDDDQASIMELDNLVQADLRFERVGLAKSIHQLDELVQRNEVQLVFADIKIGQDNFLDYWNQLTRKTEIIIVTAYPEFALKAFEHEAIHFITKPIKAEKVYTAIERAYRKISLNITTTELTFFFLQTGKNKYTRLTFDEILFVEADGEYLKIILADSREILVFKRLKTLLQELPKKLFKQIHRSYIINLSQIDSIDFHEVTFKGNKKVPVGKTFKSTIDEILIGNSTSINHRI
jgi:two-component system LytT family response regulator